MDNDAHTPPPAPVPSRIRLTGPASVVAAVPHLLGFAPQRSAVLVFVGDERREIRLTVRLDLPAPDDDIGVWVAALVRTGRFADARAAILVVVDEVAGVVAPALPWQRLVEASAHELERHDIELVDALLVGSELWWSYLCDNANCCPPEGTALQASEAWRVQAAFAYEGVATLPSRDAIADRLRPLGDEWCSEVAERIDWFTSVDFDADEVFDLLTLSTDHDSVLRQDPEVAAQALVAMRNVNVRDAVIVGLVGRIDERGARSVALILDALCSLVRAAPRNHVAPIASVVAVIAWQCGNGALASCALDRALEAEPEYSLALLIDAMVRNGVPPHLVRSGLAGLEVPHSQVG